MLTYIWLIGAGLLLAILYLRQSRRAAAIRALATQLGFHYLGRGVPRSLTLNGTQLDGATSLWNVIDGERQGVRVIAFDCRIGAGKGSWRRTVIAAESDGDVFGAVPFDRDIMVERSGNWIILYQPKAFSLIPPGLMSVTEIEAHLNAVRKMVPASGD